jgi:hypothetical protein
MARKKIITDEDLKTLFDQFLIDECHQDIQRYKIPRFGDYLRKNGYPSINDYIIRRNRSLSSYVNKQRDLKQTDDNYIIASFRSIDPDTFIKTNHGYRSLKRALSELNLYYKSVCASATRMNEQSIEIIENKSKDDQANFDLRTKNSLLKKENEELKRQNKEYLKHLKGLKKIVETYVYDEIANELLKSEGLLLDTNEVIDLTKLEKEIIRSETNIKSKSNVIQGLFEMLEE